MRDFSFNGVSLSSFGGRIIESPMHTIATRDKSFTKIYGQSGDELIDNGSYNNVNFSVKIGFFTFVSHQTAEQLASAIINWLAPLQDGYYIYRDTYNTGYFTRAALLNFDEIVLQMRTFLTATLNFSRVPFWYSDSGTTAITFSDQGIIVNPTEYTSEPIITLTSYDVLHNLKLIINGVETVFNSPGADIPVVFDCVRKQNYQITTGGKIYLSADLPPDLSTGENLISLSTSQVTCSIVPNWRKL